MSCSSPKAHRSTRRSTAPTPKHTASANLSPMPKHIPKETTQSLRISAGSTWLFTRPVTLDLAKRLQANCLQIMALNEANKSLEDASSALGLEKQTLVNYIDAIGVTWQNKRTYTRRNPNRFKS